MEQQGQSQPEQRAEWLALALLITFGAWALPMCLYLEVFRSIPKDSRNYLDSTWGLDNVIYLIELAYGLILAVPTWKRSGLHFGQLRGNVGWVLLVCGSSVVFAAVVVHPLWPGRGFEKSPIGTWLISPLAQELVFSYLYGRFEPLWPNYVHHRFRIKQAMVISNLFFAASHLPGIFDASTGYILLQCIYTFFGGCLVGLARQWTGSMFYGTITHMAINAIACLAEQPRP